MTTGVPLPEPDYRHWETNQWGHAVQEPTSAYTADQMREYATLVAAAEREACAEIVERNADACVMNSTAQMVLRSNAAAIRARGQA